MLVSGWGFVTRQTYILFTYRECIRLHQEVMVDDCTSRSPSPSLLATNQPARWQLGSATDGANFKER